MGSLPAKCLLFNGFMVYFSGHSISRLKFLDFGSGNSKCVKFHLLRTILSATECKLFNFVGSNNASRNDDVTNDTAISVILEDVLTSNNN